MALHTIGTVSKITEIHPSSLRRWEARGYIKPLRSLVASSTHRMYTDLQVELLKQVKEYLDAGYQLKAAFLLAMEEDEQEDE
jgi:DNA-binding transcriptional MerR regulator